MTTRARSRRRAVAAFALCFGLAVPSIAAAELVVDPDEFIDFGDVRVASESEPDSATEELVLANTDPNDPIEVTASLADTADCDAFALVGDTSFEIGPESSDILEVAFIPPLRGSFACTLVLDEEEPPPESTTVDLEGTGIAPIVSIDPADDIAFPDTRVGETSDDETLIIANADDGFSDVLTVSVALDGGDEDAFEAEIDDCDEIACEIEPGDDVTVRVRFTPQSEGDFFSTLVITHDDPDLDDFALAISGAGRVPLAELSPEEVDFGDVRVDQAPVTRELVLTNGGEVTFEVASVVIDDTENFAVDFAPGSAAGPLPPTESVSFEIVADLENVGTQSATVTIGTDIPDAQFQDVPVSATGVSPDLVVSDGDIRFGAHDVLAEPALRSVSVGNHADATAPLALESVQIVGLGDAVYDVVDDGGIPTTLPPGQSVDVTVAYDPVVASSGEPQATLLITSDLRNAALPISGRGIDRAIQVSPESVIFSETYRNPEVPSIRSLEVRNHGAAPLALMAAIVGGPAPEAFQVDLDALPDVLMGGESATLDIAFAPTVASASPLEARLLLYSDDRERPSVEVGLSGRSVLPNLAMTPGRLDVGSTGVDVPIRVPTPITIENLDEGETLLVRDIQLIDDSGSFSMSGWAGEETTLAPRGTIELEVEFSPSSSGTHEAVIELYLGADPVRVAVTELRGEATAFRARGGGCQVAGDRGAGGALLILVAAGLALVRRRGRGWIRTGAGSPRRGAA